MEVLQRRLLVRKLPPEKTGDMDVPAFPSIKPENFRPPIAREPASDIDGVEIYSKLKNKALERALQFSYQNGDILKTRVHFPNAEHVKEYPFNKSDWELYGNMESEAARIRFTLDTYPTRGCPESYRKIVHVTLTSDNPLNTWGERRAEIAEAAKLTYRDVLDKTIASRIVDPDARMRGYNNAFVADPVFYPVAVDVGQEEKYLWRNSLSQITSELQEGNFTNVNNFLDLYLHIKDPITPLTSTLPEQQRIFIQ